MASFPFSNVSDFDLNLVLQPQHNASSTLISDEQYEQNISNVINSNAEEFEYSFDSNDNSLINSRYYTQNQFVSKLQSAGENDLNFLHLNIRSANKNFEQLSLLLDKINADSFVIGLTETWFTDNPHTIHSLSKHNLIFNNRIYKRGGGVALYVPIHLHYIILNELNQMKETMETVFIEIKVPKRKNLIVGTVYRPPSSDHNTFFTRNAETAFKSRTTK